MKAFLHIGTTNSGNQEKQGFLMQNEAKLLEKGFIYPKSLRVANRHWALVDMVLELVEKPNLSVNVLEDLENERLLRALENFKEEAKIHKDKIFIFSAEGIVWDFPTRRHIEILENIMRNLGFDEVKIIVYFRNTLDYLNSHCSQDYKNNMGFYSGDFTPDKHPRKHIFDYAQIVKDHEAVWGEENIIVRLLRQDYVGGTMLKDFTHHLGIEWDEEFSLKQHKNESFNLLGIELQSRLNKQDLGGNFNSMLYISRKHFEGVREDRLKFRVQKDLAKAYVDYYAPSLEWVRAKYFPHKTHLFEPVNWDTYKENPHLERVTQEDWDKVVDFFTELLQSKNAVIKALKEQNLKA